MALIKRTSKDGQFCPYCKTSIDFERTKRSLLEKIAYPHLAKYKCLNCFKTFFKAPSKKEMA